MYRHRCIIYILALIALSFLFCFKMRSPVLPSENKFIIQVDSIQVTNTINFKDTLSIKFWAFIGPDLCFQFLKFEVSTQLQQIDFTLWGYHTRDDVCALAISELRGDAYKYVPTDKGMLRIVVHQPDNSTLKDSVSVM